MALQGHGCRIVPLTEAKVSELESLHACVSELSCLFNCQFLNKYPDACQETLDHNSVLPKEHYRLITFETCSRLKV